MRFKWVLVVALIGLPSFRAQAMEGAPASLCALYLTHHAKPLQHLREELDIELTLEQPLVARHHFQNGFTAMKRGDVSFAGDTSHEFSRFTLNRWTPNILGVPIWRERRWIGRHGVTQSSDTIPLFELVEVFRKNHPEIETEKAYHRLAEDRNARLKALAQWELLQIPESVRAESPGARRTSAQVTQRADAAIARLLGAPRGVSAVEVSADLSPTDNGDWFTIDLGQVFQDVFPSEKDRQALFGRLARENEDYQYVRWEGVEFELTASVQASDPWKVEVFRVGDVLYVRTLRPAGPFLAKEREVFLSFSLGTWNHRNLATSEKLQGLAKKLRETLP